MFVLVLSLSFYMMNAVQLWSYPMTTSFGYTEWSNPDSPTLISSSAECPGSTTSCWSLSSASTISYTSATSLYHHIELSYSISTVTKGGNSDYCVIDYSVDDTNWNTIKNTGTSSTDTTNAVYNAWGTAPDDITSLTVRIRYIGSWTKCDCYFNYFALSGVRITSDPTAKPTSFPTKTFTIPASGSNIWSYAMSTTPGSPWTGTDPVLEKSVHCATSSGCWKYCGLSGSTTKTYQVSASTIGYESVYLTYSIGSYFLTGSTESCSIHYSVNDVDFQPIVELRYADGYDGAGACIYSNSQCKKGLTFGGWDVDNIPSLTIRIQFQADGGTCCYFSNFVLKGVTPDPTTAPSTPSVTPTAAPTAPPSAAPTQPPSVPSHAPTALTQMPTLSPSAPTVPPTQSPICSSTGYWTDRYYYYCSDCTSGIRSCCQEYATAQLNCISTSWVNRICLRTSGYGIHALGIGWKNGEESAMIGEQDGSRSCQDLDFGDKSNVDCFNKVRIWHKAGQFTSALQFGTSAGIWKSKLGSVGETMTEVSGNAGECIKAVEVGTVKEYNTGYICVKQLAFYFEATTNTLAPTASPVPKPTASPTFATANPTTAKPTPSPTLYPTEPSINPTANPVTSAPSATPTGKPTQATPSPTLRPTEASLSTICTDNYGSYSYGDEFYATSTGFCCRLTWTSSCGESCARTKCQNGALGAGSYWIGNSGSYTCCAPTPAPTALPTEVTTNPTTATPTTPTTDPTPKPTASPTHKPTHVSPDVSHMFFMTIVANYMVDEDSFRLVLITQSDNYTDINLIGLLESPLELKFNPSSLSSITQLSEYSICSDSNSKCIKFWQIDYAQTCASGFLLSGDWKVQFMISCSGDYHDKKVCLETLEANELSNNERVSLTVSNFEFEDEICEKTVYSKVFSPQFTYYKDSSLLKQRGAADKQYKKGDVVYMKLQVEDDENAYVINDVKINNVFICSLDDEDSDFDSNLDENVNEIHGCLLSTNSLVVISDGVGETEYDANVISNDGFSFQIPNNIDVDAEELVIQIQATLSVQSSTNRRRLLGAAQVKQMRHFTTNIVLDGKANKDKGGAAELIATVGGTSVFIGVSIGIVLCLCAPICCVIYCCRRRKKRALVNVDEIMSDDLEDDGDHETEMGVTKKSDNKRDGVPKDDALLIQSTGGVNPVNISPI